MIRAGCVDGKPGLEFLPLEALLSTSIPSQLSHWQGETHLFGKDLSPRSTTELICFSQSQTPWKLAVPEGKTSQPARDSWMI